MLFAGRLVLFAYSVPLLARGFSIQSSASAPAQIKDTLKKTMSDNKVKVTVYSDNICPWCFVGKRNLEQAIKTKGLEDKVSVNWKPFFLNIDSPPDGELPVRDYLLQKYGQSHGMRMIQSLQEAGEKTGIAFTGDRVTHNTMMSHRLVKLAGEQGGPPLQNAVIEGIFSNYFEKGVKLSDVEVLAKIGQDAGMKGDLVAYLKGHDKEEEVRKEYVEGVRSMDISGVPFFIIESEGAGSSPGGTKPIVMSGARPPASFQAAFKTLLQSS